MCCTIITGGVSAGKSLMTCSRASVPPVEAPKAIIASDFLSFACFEELETDAIADLSLLSDMVCTPEFEIFCAVCDTAFSAIAAALAISLMLLLFGGTAVTAGFAAG